MRGEEALETRGVPARILLTGGTLDKIHHARTESLHFPPDDASQVPLI